MRLYVLYVGALYLIAGYSTVYIMHNQLFNTIVFF